MKILQRIILYISLFAFLTISCNSDPRVIESENINSTTGNTSSIDEVSGIKETNLDEHKVVVEEVLNTTQYTYLNVLENGKKYWIAISGSDAKVGDTYHYKGGLEQKNFYSKEFERTFETVLLVSNVWKNNSGASMKEAHANISKVPSTELEVDNITPAKGAITLSDLLANKENYNGKLVKITGKCIKSNPMIMNRNWLHIKDSSSDKFDLTVTTSENITLGEVITLEGTIALDKDFGAGYKYDIIMEDAVLKQ
jgi:predicted RNA-binding protein